MAAADLKIVIRVRWWFWFYVHLLYLFCTLFRTRPDFEKLERVIVAAIYAEFEQ